MHRPILFGVDADGSPPRCGCVSSSSRAATRTIKIKTPIGDLDPKLFAMRELLAFIDHELEQISEIAIAIDERLAFGYAPDSPAGVGGMLESLAAPIGFLKPAAYEWQREIRLLFVPRESGATLDYLHVDLGDQSSIMQRVS